MKVKKIGDIQFWNEAVVYYRNKRNAAKNPREKMDCAELLEEARMQLSWVESKILHGIMALIVLFSIFYTAGCQTMSGLGKDITSISNGFMEQNSEGK